MRGIGEVEQYQGAPNPSVGFLIDDIDFSGVGMPATLFDTRQVEVLRGPQGTVYGANALAGLINVRTEDPSQDFDRCAAKRRQAIFRRAPQAWPSATVSMMARPAGAWPRSSTAVMDIATTPILQRDDTNGYDEGTLRGKLFWQLTPALAR